MRAEAGSRPALLQTLLLALSSALRLVAVIADLISIITGYYPAPVYYPPAPYYGRYAYYGYGGCGLRTVWTGRHWRHFCY